MSWPPPVKARPADLPGLLALEERVFPEPWTEKAYRDELQSASSHVYVLHRDAHGNAQVVAFTCFRQAADEAELLRIAVAPGERRRGLGCHMAEAGLEEMRRLGARRCFLEVRDDNAAALALYRRLGFRPAGRRKKYYRDGADAVLLAADLGGSGGPPS